METVRLAPMGDTLPMFPLNSVLFPGMSVPLRVFEDRYRALVHHLLRVDDPTDRIFGSVGIREGYEVGDHGAQWLFRVGCRVKMTEVEAFPDGTFELVAVGLDRIELERLDTSGAYPVGHVTQLEEHPETVPAQVDESAREVYDAYREALLEIDREPPSGDLPQDPTYLSWALAALAPLSLLAAAGPARGRGRHRPAADGHRGDPRRAAHHAGLPVAARHRRRPHPLVPELKRAADPEGR